MQTAVAPHRQLAQPLSVARCSWRQPGRAGRRLGLSIHAASKNVLILGGTGRVGASTAAAILTSLPDVNITLASRSQASYEQAAQRRPELRNIKFRVCDAKDATAVQAALQGVDLVIHAAGPFQRSANHAVLEAALAAKVAYLDVSDDTTYSEASKARFHDAAVQSGVPAIISAGIYPGASNVMAAHVISIARKEYTPEWAYRQPEAGEGAQPKRLRYSYYTAGSGGAGRTILETSLLLAGEDVQVWRDGQQFTLPALSDRREVDFGPPLGRKGTYLYNLPEVASGRKVLGVPSISARFGTDPFIWNWVMLLIARLFKAQLSDKAFVSALANIADPLVRAADKVVGESVAMRVEVDFEGDKNAAGLFVHPKLSEAMGYSVAAFAQSILTDGTAPGVWYPEEKEALKYRRQFLTLASTGCTRFVLNRPAWSLESELKQMGLVYW